ncbi:hypothetical protein ABZ434_35075, partial [Streptomyces sp. NPDC005761]
SILSHGDERTGRLLALHVHPYAPLHIGKYADTPHQPVSGAHPYQDPACTIEERVTDLLGRMTLEEKAGQLFHTMVTIDPGGSPVEDPGQTTAPHMVTAQPRSTSTSWAPPGPREMALWHNRPRYSRRTVSAKLRTRPASATAARPSVSGHWASSPVCCVSSSASPASWSPAGD